MTLAMFRLLSVIVLALIYTTAEITTNVPNQCPQPTETYPVPSYYFYGHPNDCRYFFTCAHGTPHMHRCANGTVWNNVFKTCVAFNTEYDTCTRINAERECAKLQGGFLLIPHPTKCQRFYNCSKTTPPGQFSFLKLYEDECVYPDVFDIIQKRCVSFKEGTCGYNRVPDLDACDYVKNMCGTSHCQPCSSRNPSCAGLTDGKHAHPLRLWSGYYITCDTGRLAGTRTCNGSIQSVNKAIFSPIKNECATLWEIPREHGGLAPTCDGKSAGVYRTENPVVYYTCPSAQVSYCEVGSEFNEINKRCEKK